MKIQLHRKQNEVLNSVMHNKQTVLVAGRRFGKSRLGITSLYLKALSFRGSVSLESPETVLAVMPTALQARRIIWKPLLEKVQHTPELLRLVDECNKSEMYLKFRNKPPIRVAGANDNDGDGLRGVRCYYLYADEYQDWKPHIYSTVLRPALADTQGSSELKTGTPKGILNHLKYAFDSCSNAYHFKTLDNPFIDQEAVEEARRTTHPRLFRQEYEASFEEFAAKIYTELNDTHLIPKPYLEYDLTVAGIDWGDRNPAIAILGRFDGTWYQIDYWENTADVALPTEITHGHYVRLCNKYRVSRAYCDPSRPTSIIDLRAMGIPAVAGFNPVNEGVDQVHNLIFQGNLKFTDKRVFDLMQSYHYKTDKSGAVLPVEADGEWHLNDCIRYALAMGYK